MFTIYALRSGKDGRIYVGMTENLQRRLAEHNKGFVESTKSRSPFELIYYEAYKAEGDARKRESSLKLRGQARNQLKNRLFKSLQQ